MIWDELRRQLDERWRPWAEGRGLSEWPAYVLEEPPPGIEADAACNLPLLLAKPLKSAPRAIANSLIEAVQGRLEGVEHVTLAGAGFINFRLSSRRLEAELAKLLSDPLAFGRLESGREKILIEFVSANPTGPLHVGHGRGAALGDSLALILSHLGHDVTREYYINDAGNQVQLLGDSVLARIHELQGKPFELPAEGYHGDYVKEIAQAFLAERPGQTGDVESAKAFALKAMQSAIEKDLADFGVRFDVWFSEASVVKKGLVEKYVLELKKRGCVEEAEGALWFVAPTPSPLVGEGRGEGTPHPGSARPSLPAGKALPGREREDRSPHPNPLPGREREELRDKNRVIRRKDGRWTYFATDIAYHADKYVRGYDRLIDVWGADHHGYVPRVKGSMQALGFDPGKLHVVLNQLVALTRGGVPVAMSKRSGDFITLREVVAEVGKDACRFFFALRGPNTALEFDLELAKKQSVDNPVYYLQYAHARICSIFRQAAVPSPAPGEGLRNPEESFAMLSLLIEKEERDLLKRIAYFPHVLRVCSHEDSPHPLANYLLALARQFHHFYDHHRVLGENPALTQARLALIDGVRKLLKVGLNLLGVSAPESM